MAFGTTPPPVPAVPLVTVPAVAALPVAAALAGALVTAAPMGAAVSRGTAVATGDGGAPVAGGTVGAGVGTDVFRVVGTGVGAAVLGTVDIAVGADVAVLGGVTVTAVVAVGPDIGTTVGVAVGITGVTGEPVFKGVPGGACGGGAGTGRSGDSISGAGGLGDATTVGGVKGAKRSPAMSPRRAASRQEKLSVLVPPRNSCTVKPPAVWLVTANPLQSARGVRNTWYPLVTATVAKSGSSATVALPPVRFATPKSSNQGSGDSVQYNRR